MDVFSAFIAAIGNANQRRRTQEVLRWVGASYPLLTPEIKWNQPMFLDHGTFIVGFSVAKQHLAVAPESAAIQKFSDLIRSAGYQHSQQLLRIGWDDPVDYALLETVIDFNIADKAHCKTFWRPAAKPQA
ncbi:MAG: iron chaperone [Pseudomonadota bacterium]